MGKYATLKNKLEKFSEPPGYQAKLDEIKAQLKLEQKSGSELSVLFVAADLDEEEAAMALKEKSAVKKAIEQCLLAEWEDEGVSSMKLSTGSLLYTQSEPYSQVEDKLQFDPWIDANGYASLRTLNYQTMNAMVKAMLLKGEPIPPGVKVFMKDSIRRRGNA